MSFFSLNGRIVRNRKLNNEYTGNYIQYMAVGTGTNHGAAMDVQGPIVGTGVSSSGSWQKHDDDDWKLHQEIARTAIDGISASSDNLYVSGTFTSGALSGVSAAHEIGLFATATIPTGANDFTNVMFARVVRCKQEDTNWVVDPKFLTGAASYTLRVMVK